MNPQSGERRGRVEIQMRHLRFLPIDLHPIHHPIQGDAGHILPSHSEWMDPMPRYTVPTTDLPILWTMGPTVSATVPAVAMPTAAALEISLWLSLRTWPAVQTVAAPSSS